MIFTPSVKFAFIGGCLLVALLSGARRWNTRDWLWLVAALSFTLLSDYFLILRHEHLFGVAAFCFVHICYIFRAVKFKKNFLAPIFIFVIIWASALAFGSVIVLAGLYAALFAVNIYVNFKETRRPKLNHRLVTAGLVLFALCDICVMLVNLPRYANVTQDFSAAFPLIWVFYLPSQALLAVSSYFFHSQKSKFAHQPLS